MTVVYDLFVSGGKDSVVAATVAFEEAKQLGIPARIVFINELPAFQIPIDMLPFNPLDYVKRFSEWLGVELVVLEPKINYWEGVKRWGYPMIYHNRWCYKFMKRDVLEEFVEQEVREGYSRRVWVLGIRASESTRRRKIFSLGRRRYTYWIGGYMVEYYLPILDWTDQQVERFITEKNIPYNPLWKYDFSFECLCMAGMTITTLDRIIAELPQLARWLAQKDKEVQSVRRNGPAYPAPLLDRKVTLHEYIERKLRQPRLTQYLEAGGME
jgi:3'-phosphoadenosine 5'-phosphosulfate sulfotransferase (PAPS reductase)/FAD synthetase